MTQYIIYSALIGGAVFAALVATLGLAGAVHLTSARKSRGYMHLIFPAMIMMVALTMLLSGRDLASQIPGVESAAAQVGNPLVRLIQPLVSLLMVLFAGERLASYLIRRDRSEDAPQMPALLLASFIIFWTGTVAAPGLLGAHPRLSHAYLYPLIIAMAALLSRTTDLQAALRATRNAMLIFMVVGVMLIPVKTGLVLETSYTQGLLPGVPRFAGLAAHAVSMGMLAQIGLLCLLASPFKRIWLNRLAWVLGLGVLFLAQSKTSWISFALCAGLIVMVQHAGNFWRRFGDPAHPEFGIVSILGFMLGIIALVALAMFGDVGGRLDSFFNSAEGAQLASLTGRDQIWAIAYQEWQRNPVFGYGPDLWDLSFRDSIGMPNATHAHNQFMDTLSRSGTVGATALVIYAVVLLVLSIRHARASGGLSLALFAALAIRSISEVPLLLSGYGPELIAHVLLLMTLAAATAERRAVRKKQVNDRARKAAAGTRRVDPTFSPEFPARTTRLHP